MIRCRLLVTAFLVLAAQGASAYPVAPRPLWRLTRDADLIVVAEVRAVRKEPRERGVARLVVREVWKGSAQQSRTVKVVFTHSICPAPAKYVPGRTVLAFLERAGDGRFITVGSSYGSLYPPPEDLPIFRERVKEALRLQARPELFPGEWVEWHVGAAIRAATRWHGLYPLLPRRRYRPRASPYEIQRRRIANGFVAEPRVDVTFPMVLDILVGFEHQGVDKVAVAALDSLLAQDRAPWWHPLHFVYSVGPRLSQVVDLVAKRVGVKLPGDTAPAALRSWWTGVRRKLWPSLKPLRIPHWRGLVRGVGEETPP